MKLDSMGLALSGACLVHCLLVSVAVIAAPSASAWLGATENAMHWFLMAIAVVVSGWALYSGFTRHGVATVVMLGIAGLAVMFVGAAHLFGRAAETMLTLGGAGIVAAAHIINLRLCAGHH
jgi:hypothetical protein